MHLTDLLWLYLAVGVAFALIVYKRPRPDARKPWMSMLVSIPLWPLWIPVVMGPERRGPSDRMGDASDIEQALREGASAVRGTPLEALLPAAAVERLLQEVSSASARSFELSRVLMQPQFDEALAQATIERLEQEGNLRALASARLHWANVVRLAEMRDRDLLALDELRELVRALRTQLVLARFAGSGTEGTGELVMEMWARVESLGEVLETGEEARIFATQLHESEVISPHAASTRGG